MAFALAPQNVSLPPCPPSPTPHAAASRPDLPAIASLQNAYSLLCRTFDAGLAECCHAERVSLLAYSPLAMVRHGGALRAGMRCLTGLAGARGDVQPAQQSVSNACWPCSLHIVSTLQGLLTGKYLAPGGSPPEAR